MAKQIDYQDILAHFPQTVSEEIVNYARDVVFRRSRYFFVRRDGNYQMGYCTHCQQEYASGIGSWYLKHNEPFTCLHCGSECVVKAAGRGRKALIDRAYFVYYEKSVIDPNAIVARGLYVVRDYSGDYTKVETLFHTSAAYLFQTGRAVMLRQDWGRTWIVRKTVGTEFYTSMQYVACYVSTESIKTAVAGTQFQYLPWEQYLQVSPDLTKFFDLAAKYPCVEYIAKLGMRDLIDHKLRGYYMYNAVNWRGKNLLRVLKLTKAELKEARNSGVRIEPLTLHSFHFFKRIGMSLTFREASLLEALSEANSHYFKEAKFMTEYAPFTEICRYILKQLNKDDVYKHYHNGRSVLTAWRDYISECKELGMDLQKPHVLFPNNIYTAHQKTTEKVRIKHDEALNIQIAQRLPSLQKYVFSSNGLFIRPAQDSIELFKEGKALNHCVGRYAKTYAEGQTNLFVIRKVDEPDAPFYTMELINDSIIQTRGKDNCAPTDEVKAFVEAFTKARLSKKSRTRLTETQAARPA